MLIRAGAIFLTVAAVVTVGSVLAEEGRTPGPREFAPTRRPTMSVTGAEITWYGYYWASTQKREADPAASGGSRRTSSNIKPPDVNSDEIILNDNTRFGLGYRLLGEPKGAAVRIRSVQWFPEPGVFNRQTKKRERLGVFERDQRIGADLFMGFVVDKAANLPTGNWVFELWYGDRKLADKTFAVQRR